MATSTTSSFKEPKPLAIALLAHKCAPYVFDLSSRQVNVSIRDQIVRGRVLAEAMVEHRFFARRALNLFVVGAGAAGASFALAAAKSGNKVFLVDTKAPFDTVAKAIHRYVGPMMYEWPGDGFDDQTYPQKDGVHGEFSDINPGSIGASLNWSSTHPLAASQLAIELGNSFSQLQSLHAANLKVEAPLRSHLSPQAILDFSMRRTKSLDTIFASQFPGTTRVDFLVLSSGMGQEDIEICGKTPGHGFWDPKSDPRKFGDRVGIFGCGDGGIQDFLLALFPDAHPLALMERIQAEAPTLHAAIKGASPLLNMIEWQFRAYIAWRVPDKVTSYLDQRVQAVAKTIATDKANRNELGAMFRPNPSRSVCLVNKFAGVGKAYMLNRFLYHLLREFKTADPGYPGSSRAQYDVFVKREPNSVQQTSSGWEVKFDDGSVRTFDNIAVRFGIRPATIPHQNVGLRRKMKDKLSLKGLGLPISY